MTTTLAHNKFSWCEVGQCHGTETAKACPGKVQKFTFEKHRGKERVKMLDEYRQCPCKCHGKVNKDEVTKTRRPRRK